MKQTQNTRGYERYFAIDTHREYHLVGGQNEEQEWVVNPRRVGIEKFAEWAQNNFRKGDIVVLGTTTNVWETHEIVAPLVSRVIVANAAAVELFEDFTGIHVSKDVGQRYTEEAGRYMKNCGPRKWRRSRRSDQSPTSCQANYSSAPMGIWCRYYMGSGWK